MTAPPTAPGLLLYTQDPNGIRYNEPPGQTGGGGGSYYDVSSTQAYVSDSSGQHVSKMGPRGCTAEALSPNRRFALLICDTGTAERLLRVSVANGKIKTLVTVGAQFWMNHGGPDGPWRMAGKIRWRVGRRIRFIDDAAISPNGRTAVFSESGFEDGNSGERNDLPDVLYSIPVQGGRATMLRWHSGKPLVGGQPTFSPDGKLVFVSPSLGDIYNEHLAIIYAGGQPKIPRLKNNLWTSSLAGGIATRLTNDPWGYYVACPAVSGDGRSLAYEMSKEADGEPLEMELLTLSTGKTQPLGIAVDGVCPKFAPDGSAVAFTLNSLVGDPREGAHPPVQRAAVATLGSESSLFVLDPQPSWIADWR
jgi:hypothetical protein